MTRKFQIVYGILFGFGFLTTINFYFVYKQVKRESHQNLHLSYKLDFTCTIQNIDKYRLNVASTFEKIYNTGKWGVEESRSGGGSRIAGAIDWISYLNSIIKQYQIRYVADIPCGDTNWQFASREMNTLPFYFGGDISTSIISRNQKLYANHLNKMFAFWDLVQCPIPRFSIKNSTGSSFNNTFDLVIVRDAIQHMNILNALKAMRHIIKSGISYLAVSSYPSQPCANFCVIGNITDGESYANNMNCPPFNFPAPLIQALSHKTIKHEPDEFHLYKIDSQFIKISDSYDKACR